MIYKVTSGKNHLTLL